MSTAARHRSVRERLSDAAPFGVGALVAFSAAAVGAGMGRALVTTYLPVLLERIRDAPGLIGTVMLVNTVAGFAVPLVVGAWSDQLRDHRHGRTMPFVLGGALVASGGLLAIALGYATSYFALALFAAVTYTGLNAVTTAHRALIPENFGEKERAAATGGEELAMLLGGLVGVVVGGLLIETAGWAPFAVGAALVPLLALPTVRRMRGRERSPVQHPRARLGLRYYWRAANLPGGRLILAAQGFWVLGYIGLPPFFILYAQHELGLSTSSAALILAGVGIATGVAMIAAGAAPPRSHHALLALAAMAMGGGLLAVAASSSVGAVAAALVLVAAGFGVLTTLGFAVYADYIPAGEEGAYSALYFSVRSVASAIAVPAAGWTIAATGSYRALFVFGGVMTLAALVPLVRLLPGQLPPIVRRAALGLLQLAGLAATALALGLLVHHTALFEADRALVDLVHGIGSSPRLVDQLLVDPHIENYTVLSLVTGAGVWLMWREVRAAAYAVALMVATAIVSYLVVVVDWTLWERPRPQEVLSTVPANGHDWSSYPSYPSGHVVVTTALVVVASTLVPRLRTVLLIYASVIALTRISYGAHFPSDVAAGVVIGVASAWIVLWVAGRRRAPHVAIPWLPVFDDVLRARARRAARWIGTTAVVAFVVLLLAEGPPAAPEGGVLDPVLADRVQVALLALAVICVAGAWWRELFGVPLLFAGAGLGVFAALEYTPSFALASALAFVIPGALFLVAWPRVRTRARAVAVVALVTAVMTAGGVAAYEVHDRAYGPQTPQSTREPAPTWRVDWAWSGAVTTDSFTVAARIDDDSEARLIVARDAALRQRVTASPVQSTDEFAKFHVSGLEPDTPYYYGIEVDGRVDPYRVGRTRTFPSGARSFTFATAGCARVGSNAEVFETIRRSDPLFFLSLGDLFYGNVRENSRNRVLDQYRRVLDSPAQSALYRSVPIAYTWDDHDFGGDSSDSTAATRPAARWVYDTLVPHYALESAAIYQGFDAGRVRFLVLDTRSERSPDSQPDDARKTMLGARQKAWLKRELLAARDDYKLTVIVSSVPWISATAPGEDDWGGFSTERAELSRFIAAHGVENLLMLAGDAHMFAIDDGSHTDYSGTGRAGFPLMHAGALDRPGHAKGGPYSEGAYPGAGQYGSVAVRDGGGDTIEVTLSGHEYDGAEIASYTFRTKP